MWLVSCRRQGMLTQGPTPDPTCKLIISSFLTLPHLLDYLVYTRNVLSIALLFQMRGRMRQVGGGYFILACWWGNRWQVSSYVVFSYAFVFCSLTFSVPLFKWLEHDGCCVRFFNFSLFSLSLVPLPRSYWCKKILKVRYLVIILWVSLEKGDCFDLAWGLGIWLVSFQVRNDLIGFTKVDLLKTLLEDCFRGKLRDDQ